jgi:N-acetylmuramoyl-L-alanine amidase|tara:strand:+ start:6535 stop:7083 length:549 start_codon:yes stop_codon:yes gene_type:complete
MIGLAIGHSRRGDNGAYTVGANSISEHSFNSELVPLITPHIKVPYKIYDDYNATSYVGAMNYVSRKMREDNVDACIEFHFNAATPTATGHEWLHWETSSGGKRLATKLKEAMVEEYPDLRSRGVKPRSKGHRGALFLRTTPCYACIAEPFFGSNVGDVSLIRTNTDRLAKVYANGINNFYGE